MLYAEVVGEGWGGLPAAVRRVHGPGCARGHFDITRGPGALTALAAWAFRLPPPAASAPVTLEVTETRNGQQWDRHFGGARLLSTQHREGAMLVERLGPVECVLEAAAAAGHLKLTSVGANLRVGPLRLPLPRALRPHVDADAFEEESRVRVTVEIRVGGRLLMRYAGLVEPA